MRGMELWKDDVLYGDGSDTLCSQPTIRDCPHVILGREVFKDRDGEHHLLRCLTDNLEGGGRREEESRRSDEGGRGTREEDE